MTSMLYICYIMIMMTAQENQKQNVILLAKGNKVQNEML